MKNPSWLLLVAVAACGGPELPPSAPSALTDKNAPSLDATAMDGREIRDKRLRGKITIVTFFSKQCLACERWTPAIEMISREERDVTAVGISQDEFEADARDLVTTWRITYPVVHDKGRPISTRFTVGELPTTVVIDAVGVVRWVGGPSQTEADLRSAIQIIRDRPR
jgi:peroxiredoxin